MKSSFGLRKFTAFLWLAAIVLITATQASGQAPAPAWGFTRYFKYNIENIVVHTTTPGTWNVKVVFSVTNPNPDAGVPNTTWNIKSDLPFQSVGAGLTIDIGWDAKEFTNTGSVNAVLSPVMTTTLGTGAAYPVQIRSLLSISVPPGANPCLDTIQCPGVMSLTNRYWIQRAVNPVAFITAVTAGRIGIEGKPVCNGLPGCPTAVAPFANIPVRSEVGSFSFLNTPAPTSAVIPDPRRKIVDFDTKCNKCHNGSALSGSGTLIPRLSLHGNNRNENLQLCVMCHASNQTDVPYRVITADSRTSGPETSVDFKRMIHSIHAGEFRHSPFVVVGFNTSIHDYSEVKFPGKLRNCLNCHLDNGSKGTFELPIAPEVLGTTVNTGSTYAVVPGANRTIDVNPFNDLKVTPTAAACSGCHDEGEVRSHMIRTGGASFSTLQQNIGVTVVERCVNCHGPGKEKDVRKVHEIKITPDDDGR